MIKIKNMKKDFKTDAIENLQESAVDEKYLENTNFK